MSFTHIDRKDTSKGNIIILDIKNLTHYIKTPQMEQTSKLKKTYCWDNLYLYIKRFLNIFATLEDIWLGWKYSNIIHKIFLSF